MESYTYSVADDTASGRVDPGSLHAAVAASGLPGFLGIGTDGCSKSGGTYSGGIVLASFSSSLDASQQATLAGLVAAHDPATLSAVRIFDYVPDATGLNLYAAPVDLDYKTGLTRSMPARRTIVLGEVVQVEYFDSYDAPSDTFTDLVLNVDVTYVRDPMGLVESRDTVRTWYQQDGNVATPTKTTTKIYRGNERTAELFRRAENGIAMQNTVGLGLIIQDQMANHGKSQPEAVAIGMGYADQWYAQFEGLQAQFRRTNSRSYWDAIQAVSHPSLQWVHDTPGFLAAVSDEVNFGGWT